MHRHRINWLSQLVPSLLLSIGSAACLAADEVPPSLPETPVLPNAAGFDALFKRLEYGDLTALDNKQQQQVEVQLQKLLPPGDAHRERLLDSSRCSLDFVNRTKDGYAFADAKLAAALNAADAAAAIRFYYCRGEYQGSLSTQRDALADFERGIDMARTIDDDLLVAAGLGARGATYSLLGIHGKALADLLEVQRIYQQHELNEASSQTLLGIGTAYRRLGYLDKAREYINQSIEHAQHVGDHETLQGGTMELGFIDRESGRYASALTTFRHALELAAPTGDRVTIASTNVAMAGVLNDLHRYPEALDSLQKAETDFAAAGDNSFAGTIAYDRGRAMAGQGRRRDALDQFDRAGTAFEASGNQRYLERLHESKAQTLEAAGQTQASLEEYKHYLATHEEVMRQRTDQQAQMLREQFDTDRAKLENARLKAEQALKEREVESLQKARRWQQLAMGLLALVLGMLSVLVVRQLARLRVWKRMASVDALTGVPNLRGVEAFANRAMRAARTNLEPLAVLAIDVDRFKSINDNHGHAAGDRVLQQIARACDEAMRDGDLLGRIGGEEFLAVLPGTKLDHALDVAERLRSRVAALDLADVPTGVSATISIGASEMLPEDTDFDSLKQRADEAMYRAKEAGRNRVVSAWNGTQERGASGATGTGAAAATGGAGVASR
jgi:diguanylate cyclase (GGDEF)-like protein